MLVLINTGSVDSLLHKKHKVSIKRWGCGIIPTRKFLLPVIATKRKAYTISTTLQAMAVAERTSKEAAAKRFSADPRRIHSGVMMLTISDNFRVARIVRLQWITMLPTGPYNKNASQQSKYEYRFSLFVDWIEELVTST